MNHPTDDEAEFAHRLDALDARLAEVRALLGPDTRPSLWRRITRPHSLGATFLVDLARGYAAWAATQTKGADQ